MTNVEIAVRFGRKTRLYSAVIYTFLQVFFYDFFNEIHTRKNLIIPKIGIYATKVYIDSEVYVGATNIGYNPTVNGEKMSVETNILQFDKDIYGKTIKLEFLERIRDEKKFKDLNELKIQLKMDTNYIYKKYICKSS